MKKQFALQFKLLCSVQTGLIWACLVLVAVMAGPFGTLERLTMTERTGFWVIVVTASVVLGYVFRALSFALIRQDRRLLQETFIVLLLVVVLSPIVWWITQQFSALTQVGYSGLGHIMVFVGIIGLAFAVIRHLVPELQPRGLRFLSADRDTTSQHVSPPAQPRLLRRLEPDVAGPILRITAQNHQVEVATVNGVQMVRLRLTDAINEMEPVEGYCTHRSHWVTRMAIDRVERENSQKTWIVLTNGDRVPVSRKYRPDLEAAGIL